MTPQPIRLHSSFSIQHSSLPRRAFTLVELLVVIGIIGVLIAITIPLVGKVRDAARATDTQALLTSLGAQIQAYHGDFRAYPGPLSNFQINGDRFGAVPQIVSGGVAQSADLDAAGAITGTENLVLGLLGGLRRDAASGEIQYETAWVGNGPGALGTVPKKLPPYGDLSDLSLRTAGGELTGDYISGDSAGGISGEDTTIPEYVDRFTDPMPLLFLRARAGARSTGTTAADNPIVTDGTTPARSGQYDYSQISGYVAAAGGKSIGIGKSLSASEYKNATVGEHGLQPGVLTATTDSTSPGYSYPYNLYAALRHPTQANTPKQKDGFILISAGIDRVYGTKDDITNFGAY